MLTVVRSPHNEEPKDKDFEAQTGQFPRDELFSKYKGKTSGFIRHLTVKQKVSSTMINLTGKRTENCKSF